MATADTFEELKIWQAARQLTKYVYRVTKQRAFRRDFSLRDQITRAATSAMSNIAEGFERGSRKEFIQFLNVAKGSTGEVRSQLYVALDQDYLDADGFDGLRAATLSLSRQLASFISYLEKYPSNRRQKSVTSAAG